MKCGGKDVGSNRGLPPHTKLRLSHCWHGTSKVERLRRAARYLARPFSYSICSTSPSRATRSAMKGKVLSEVGVGGDEVAGFGAGDFDETEVMNAFNCCCHYDLN
jgi:hypothetical protein